MSLNKQNNNTTSFTQLTTWKLIKKHRFAHLHTTFHLNIRIIINLLIYKIKFFAIFKSYCKQRIPNKWVSTLFEKHLSL